MLSGSSVLACLAVCDWPRWLASLTRLTPDQPTPLLVVEDLPSPGLLLIELAVYNLNREAFRTFFLERFVLVSSRKFKLVHPDVSHLHQFTTDNQSIAHWPVFSEGSGSS